MRSCSVGRAECKCVLMIIPYNTLSNQSLRRSVEILNNTHLGPNFAPLLAGGLVLLSVIAGVGIWVHYYLEYITCLYEIRHQMHIIPTYENRGLVYVQCPY